MRSKKILFNLFVITMGLTLTQACVSQSGSEDENQTMVTNDMAQPVDEAPEITKAICVLQPTEGNDVTGTVTFTKTSSGISIVADVNGLTPGKHGFHIHQYGDVSALDGTSAGGHFNPDGTQHGGPNATVRHVGDLGNIEADDSGHAHLEMTDQMISLNGAHSIIGRAIIVHAGEDDLTSQPTGAAGSRVAYGVIGIGQ